MTVVGIGTTAGIRADEVLAAIDAVLPPGATDVRLATLDARAAEIGIIAAAVARRWPLTGYSAAELARMAVPTPSDRVATLVGTASVAEAAALLGGGTLLVPKTVHGRVTVAVAVSELASEPGNAARPGSRPPSASEVDG